MSSAQLAIPSESTKKRIREAEASLVLSADQHSNDAVSSARSRATCRCFDKLVRGSVLAILHVASRIVSNDGCSQHV